MVLSIACPASFPPSAMSTPSSSRLMMGARRCYLNQSNQGLQGCSLEALGVSGRERGGSGQATPALPSRPRAPPGAGADCAMPASQGHSRALADHVLGMIRPRDDTPSGTLIGGKTYRCLLIRRSYIRREAKHHSRLESSVPPLCR